MAKNRIREAQHVLRGRAAGDALVIFGSFSALYAVAVLLGIAEWLHAFLERRDELAIDELFVLGSFATTALLVFAARRSIDQHVEIQRRKVAEQQLELLANLDPLTGLANRRQLNEALQAVSADPSKPHTLLLVDLNDFKRINDFFGHPAGDEVLVAIAQRLRSHIGGRPLIARLGGDEFAVLCADLKEAHHAKQMVKRALSAFDLPLVAAGIKHPLGVGIGVASSPGDATTPSELMRRCDIALYRAKRSKDASSVCYFEPAFEQDIRAQADLETELRAALKAGAIVPHFQPIIELKSGVITGFEALARWTHPVRGAIPPDVFIAVAEKTGQIRELTEVMLRSSCRAAAAWPSHIRLAINLSAYSLKDPLIGQRILRVLHEASCLPSRLEIEVTETALVNDLEAAQQVFGSLRNAGVRIALDDFGTGYASIYHLRNFQFDALKIDRSYVAALGTGTESDAIVRAMLMIGEGLHLSVTAEGIETDAQRGELRRLGCHEGQGYLFGKAVPAEEARELSRGVGRQAS
jgi:diguanylate cyclase (GGDEF)-like protein